MDIVFAIIKSLNDIGIDIEYNDNVDIDLLSWLQNSLLFISFIVELENNLGIELPYEMLLTDNLSSLNGFSKMLVELKSHPE